MPLSVVQRQLNTLLRRRNFDDFHRKCLDSFCQRRYRGFPANEEMKTFCELQSTILAEAHLSWQPGCAKSAFLFEIILQGTHFNVE